MKKNMLILKMNKTIPYEEIANVASQIQIYGVSVDLFSFSLGEDELYYKLFSLEKNKYDYIYLVMPENESNLEIRPNAKISWLDFAVLLSYSDIMRENSTFIHPCRGTFKSIAWQLFNCCKKIEYVCSPMHKVRMIELITAINLLLFTIEVRLIEPLRAAEKIASAIDVKFSCYDRTEENNEIYQNFCIDTINYKELAFKKVISKMNSFDEVNV